MRLIQEKHRRNTWDVLVSCLMLNKTSGRVAESFITEFLRRWPTPKKYLLSAIQSDVVELIRPLGLYNVRAKRLGDLARCLVNKTPCDQIPGVGKYGRDSYLIFVEGRLNVTPDDKALKARLKELLESSERRKNDRSRPALPRL